MSDWSRFLRQIKRPLKAGTWDYSINHVRNLHNILGRPSDHYPIVHVGGTNGKGTVSYQLAKMLELSGYRTGLFLSPHLYSWRERVQVNSQLISQEACIKFMQLYEELSPESEHVFSYFEFFVSLAYNHFFEQKVDIAVVEVGLGGRYDATNLIEQNLLSIITSISLDHTHILGDTVEKIAEDKAGIIKRGCPVLVGPSVPKEVVTKAAARLSSPLYFSKASSNRDYDEENRLLLKEAQKLLSSRFHIPDETFDKVIRSHSLPGRFESVPADFIPGNKGFAYLDVGHNPAALKKVLRRLISEKGQNCRFSVVYGCKSKKDVTGCLREILECSQVHAVSIVSAEEGKMAGTKEILGKLRESRDDVVLRGLEEKRVRVVGGGKIHEALEHFYRNEGSNGSEGVLVIGSFKLMKEANDYFGIKVPSDADKETV